MLALTSYEQSNGFSALNADELYFINGGSWSWSGASQGAMHGMVEGAITGAVGGAAAGATAGSRSPALWWLGSMPAV